METLNAPARLRRSSAGDRCLELLLAGALAALIIGSQNGWCLSAFLFEDDFVNLRHAATWNLLDLLRGACFLDPHIFRPVGIGAYRLLWASCGWHAGGYHAAALLLHLANTLQVYGLARHLSQSRFVALMVCLAQAYQPSNQRLYCDFGLIFDLLAALWYWRAFLWYVTAERSGEWRWWGALVSFVLALGSKETAVTLPLVLTAYELLWRRPDMTTGRRPGWLRRLAVRQWPWYLLAGIFVLQHFLVVRSPYHPPEAYVFVFTVQAWVAGMAYYLRQLAPPWCPWPWWLTLCLGTILLAWLQRDRRMWFGWCYAALSLLPVVFLVHHRYPYYWYLPQFGLLLVLGCALEHLRDGLLRPQGLRSAWPRRLVTVSLAALLPSLAVVGAGSVRLREERWWLSLSEEYRRFMGQMLARYPTLPPNTMLVFRSAPERMTSHVLRSFLRTLYRDPSLGGVIEPCPWTYLPVDPAAAPPLFLEYAQGTVRPLSFTPHTAPLGGRVEPLGPATGWSGDRWVIGELQCRFRTLHATDAILVQGHVPKHLPAHRMLTLTVGDQSFSKDVGLGPFAWRIPLSLPGESEHTLRLASSVTWNPWKAGVSEDRRELAFQLICILIE